MNVVIPGVRGSLLHEVAIDVLVWHIESALGYCVRCGGRTPCPARQNAYAVLAAAGDDPTNYGVPPLPRSVHGVRTYAEALPVGAQAVRLTA